LVYTQRTITVLVLSCILLTVMGVILFRSSTGSHDKNTAEISSPNGKVNLNFSLSGNGTPQYQISYNGASLIDPSSLGFQFKNQAPLSGKFKIVNTSATEFNETWEPVWGEKDKIKNHYKQLTVHLQEKDSLGRKMDLEFRLFDNGVGFRYVLPEQQNLDGSLQITSEDTQFKFSANNTSWWIANDWDSSEKNYKQSLLNSVQDVQTPFTMKTPGGIHITVHEAALIDYAGMALHKVRGEKNTLSTILAPWPNSDVKVIKESLPVITPWRTVEIGENAGDLVESDMILNLNEPNAIEDTSWIKPLKYVGIWWEMHIGKSSWASGANHGATTENAKRYIDFAHEHLDTKNQNIGLLVEGWNKGWDGDWTQNGDLFDFTKAYPDFDLKEVVKYGEERGVAYIAHNETSGDIQNYEDQMEDAYELYENLGIHAIKSGYVADKGMKDPAGQHHDGQYMVNHYVNAVKKAADHKIMINTHEPIKDTGLSRTYPNWMSREGVRGMEYNAWSEGSPPEHLTILPFTRMMAGSIDFTPGIFDVEIASKPDNRVHTTRAQQIALYVIITSGVQMVTDLPENYKDEQGNILPEFKFIKDVPVTWDNIMVPNAEIGDYITVVRRSGEQWYIGSTTDEEARDWDIDLSFLDIEKKYVAEIYSDGPDANWETNPNPVSITKVIVDAKDTLVASLAAGGGQAVRLYPASEEELKAIADYEVAEVHLSNSDIPASMQANDRLDVKVTVQNKGNIIAGKKLELQVDGQTVAEQTIRLGPGDSKEVVLSYDKLFKPGDHQISINGKSDTVKVTEKVATYEFSDLKVSTAVQTITATAAVTNYGSYEGTVEVPLYINGRKVDSKPVTIPARAGGGAKKVTFAYQVSDTGIYEVAIGNLESQIAAYPMIDLAGSWLFNQGDDSSWKETEFDDSGWQEVRLPSSWEDHSNYTKDNVYGWYRKTVVIPNEWKGYSLKVRLGKMDDVDITFFNGYEIGKSGKFPTGIGEAGMESAWEQERVYEIPADAIKYGQQNVISIRMFDAIGGGGLYSGTIDSIEVIK